MPANTLPIYPLTIQSAVQSFVNADGTSEKTLVTAGANGSRIDSIGFTSDDISARVFNILINNGSTSYKVGTVNVPVAAGTDAAITPAVSAMTTSMLPWLDASGSVFLKAGWKINIQAQVAVTSGKQINAFASYGDY